MTELTTEPTTGPAGRVEDEAATTEDGAEPKPLRASVTVIVATRDRPELLRQALAAILGQRYAGDIDVLVVFDQSEPDGSLVVDRPADDGSGARRRTSVLRNDRAPGLAGARNTGILTAEGDLVAFCDDDDLWSPGKLDAQVAMLEADPGLEMVTCGLFVEARGRITPRVLDHERVTYADLLRSRVMEAHPSTYLTRRSAILDAAHPGQDGGDGIGLVDEDLPGSYAEDYDWVLRAARRHPVGAVRLPLVKVVWHRSSFFAERWETIIAALDHLIAKYPELAGEPVGLARIEGQQAFALAALGRRAEARAMARTALGHHRTEARAWLALAMSTGLVRSDQVLRALQAVGRGV